MHTTAAMRLAARTKGRHRAPGPSRLIARLHTLILGAVVASAQQVSYTTSVVTSCFDLAGGAPSTPSTAPDHHPPAGGLQSGRPNPGPGQVEYTMPACAGCDCATCTLTSVYTATFSVLCATGLAAQAYTVTETYIGLSALPGFAAPTRVPYGFTTAVETCGACGVVGADGGPLVTTVTFPSAGRPYVDGFTPTPTPAPMVGGGDVGAAPPESAPAPYGSDDTADTGPGGGGTDVASPTGSDTSASSNGETAPSLLEGNDNPGAEDAPTAEGGAENESPSAETSAAEADPWGRPPNTQNPTEGGGAPPPLVTHPTPTIPHNNNNTTRPDPSRPPPGDTQPAPPDTLLTVYPSRGGAGNTTTQPATATETGVVAAASGGHRAIAGTGALLLVFIVVCFALG